MHICFCGHIGRQLESYISNLLLPHWIDSLTLILSKSTPQLSLYLTSELRYAYFSVLTAMSAAILDSYTFKLLQLRGIDSLKLMLSKSTPHLSV